MERYVESRSCEAFPYFNIILARFSGLIGQIRISCGSYVSNVNEDIPREGLSIVVKFSRLSKLFNFIDFGA